MVEYAAKLTQAPAAIVDSDVQRLRDLGLSEDQVWLATFTVGIFNLFARMADAFGLRAPDRMIESIERG